MRLNILLITFLVLFLGRTICASIPEDQETIQGISFPTERENALFLDVPDHELIKILDDPLNRISSQFKTPPGIKAMVGFWFLIYSKYSLYQTLIYDQNNKDKIYAVVDSSDLFKTGKSAVQIEITSKLRIKKALQEVRGAMAQLIKNPSHRFSKNSIGEKITTLWGKKSSSHWKTALGSIKMQSGQRDRVMQGIRLSEPFLPIMEKIFISKKIPEEITRIPLVESSFIIKAQSKADAVGVWQFLEKSAKEYLTVDSKNKIDERISPLKATYAAAEMFKRNYKILDDWGLAIIAYNHGQKNLIPIRHKYKGKNIISLLEKNSGPLGYASKNYYAEFLALLHAEKYKEFIYKIKFREDFNEVALIRLKVPTSVYDLSSVYNVSIHDLKVYNPDIFDIKRKLPAGTKIILPRKSDTALPSFSSNSTEKTVDRFPANNSIHAEQIDLIR